MERKDGRMSDTAEFEGLHCVADKNVLYLLNFSFKNKTKVVQITEKTYRKKVKTSKLQLYKHA